MKVVNSLFLLVLCLFLVACGPSEVEKSKQSTELAASEFATQTAIAPTATTIPTETPVPKGSVVGRVILIDRDEPVNTTIRLELKEGNKLVNSTRTDQDGHFTFLIVESDVYVIAVSVMDLLDKCDKLRAESGGWIASQVYDGSGLADVRAMSMPMSILIGDETTVDLNMLFPFGSNTPPLAAEARVRGLPRG